MKRHLGVWLPAYLAQLLGPGPRRGQGPLTICLAVADHYEPYWGRADEQTASARVAVWEKGLPGLCRELADAAGRPPQHTFFYPLEDYRPQVLDRLAALCARGLGDVEVHLHHQGETSAQLEDMLSGFARTLHDKHGLLRRDPASGRLAYGFVHGNWALDNSLPGGAWCGVNDELSILARTGCYADFTLPAAYSPAQVGTINSIYYATDDPKRPRSHERGAPARVGQPPQGDLLLVQGVLALDWARRKLGFLPGIEHSDLSIGQPPRRERIALWLRFAPRVMGAEDVVFIKLACHGAPEKNHAALLGQPARELYQILCREYNDGRRYRLRFMTCWEMVCAIHALERGEGIA